MKARQMRYNFMPERFALRALFLVLAVFLSAMLPHPAPAAQGKVIDTVLDNGLAVVIEEVRTAPVVSVQMWVRVGSADESEREAGLSHVFEHMLFKGTERRGVGELAAEVESVGGDINAYTSFDNTVYFLTVPSRNFSTGLDVIADSIQNSKFDAGELGRELEVVLEEIRMNEDRPGRNLFKGLLEEAYTMHPYRRQVIGYRKVIEGLERDDTLKFKKKWYRPGNMTLVIAGDVDADAALSEVKAAFKRFKPGRVTRPGRLTEPPQRGLRVRLIPKDVKETHFGAAFHIPDIRSEDIYALDVIEYLLGGGPSSRLYRKVKIEDELVHSISTYSMSLKDPGLFVISGSNDTEKTNDALSATVEVVRRFADEGPTGAELERARTSIESSFVYSRENIQGIASKLGFFKTVAGDLSFQERYLEGIRTVSADDVRRVATKYLDPKGMTVAVLLPEGDVDEVTDETVRAAVAKGVEAASIKPDDSETASRADITRTVLDNGVVVLVKEARANPTVAMYAAFPAGLRFESKDNNGIGNFTAGLLARGTTSRTRATLDRELETMAGGAGGFSGWNSTGASGKFLARDFDRGFEIFADILKNPIFPEIEIEKLREDILASIRRERDNLPGYTFRLFYEAMFRDHPYGMRNSGTEESVSAISRDDIVEHYRRFFVPERMVLTVVGDIDTERAVEKARELFGDLEKSAKKLPKVPVEKRQNSIRTTGEVMDKAQTNLALGFLGASITDKDRFALKIVSEVLSGQGGRLFVKLRDQQSLAYSVAAYSKVGVDPGIFALYIASAPDKKDAALEGLLGELRLITTEKISDDELNRAKNLIIGSYQIGLQENGAQAGDITYNELYGLGYDFSEKFPALVEAVTADDVLRAAKKYLTLDAYTLSVVGRNGPGAEEADGE